MSANFVSESKHDKFTRKSSEKLIGESKKRESTESKLICNNFYPFNNRLPRLAFFGKSRNDGVDSAKSPQIRKICANKSLPNTTIIALGANLKSPLRTFRAFFHKLTQNAKIHILQTSPIYKNPPFGYANQPFFYNATMLLATSMCLMEFYAFIFYMERIFGRGRIRAFKNAPRTLDIDIIFFNDIFMRSTKLNIPHPQWQNRASVLLPLFYQANYKG